MKEYKYKNDKENMGKVQYQSKSTAPLHVNVIVPRRLVQFITLFSFADLTAKKALKLKVSSLSNLIIPKHCKIDHISIRKGISHNILKFPFTVCE